MFGPVQFSSLITITGAPGGAGTSPSLDLSACRYHCHAAARAGHQLYHCQLPIASCKPGTL